MLRNMENVSKLFLGSGQLHATVMHVILIDADDGANHPSSQLHRLISRIGALHHPYLLLTGVM